MKVIKASYTCKKCHQDLKSRTSLWRHQSICDGAVVSVESKNKFICSMCDKTYTRKSSLKRHICAFQDSVTVNIIEKEVYENISDKNEIFENITSENKTIENEIIQNKTVDNKDTINAQECIKMYQTMMSQMTQMLQMSQMAQMTPQMQLQPVKKKSFCVIDYLNNECQDAFTIKETIDKLKCDIFDVPSDSIGGFYKSLVKLVFKDIPNHKLPFRCSNIKDKTFYLKMDDGTWCKKDDFNLFKDFILKIMNKFSAIIQQYITINPNYIDNDKTHAHIMDMGKYMGRIYDNDAVKKSLVVQSAELTQINKPN